MNGGILDHRTKSSEEAYYVGILDKFVIGQKRAKEKLARRLAIYKHGLQKKDGVAGVFLFPGPSGVGKTLLVRAFARLLIGDLNGISRVDCANLQHEHTDSVLIGSPPGYVGYKEEPVLSQKRLDRPWRDLHPFYQSAEDTDKAARLNKELADLDKIISTLEFKYSIDKKDVNVNELEKLRERYVNKLAEITAFEQKMKDKKAAWETRPCSSILLFDEFEKAHSKISRILLSILDTGETRLSSGEKTNLRNCFIFMTSNIGSPELANLLSGKKAPIGIVPDSKRNSAKKDLDKKIYETVMEKIKESSLFPTELLARIGKENVIVFRSLTPEEIRMIVNMKFEELINSVQPSIPGASISVSQSVKDLIFEETQDPLNLALGARPIDNVIQAQILEPLNNLIIKGIDGGICPGDAIRIDTQETENKKRVVFIKKDAS